MTDIDTIYIVSVAPANEDNAVGGFLWDTDEDVSRDLFDAEVAESESEGGTHIVRLVAIDNPIDGYTGTDEERAEVTDILDSDIDRWERTEPAITQYVPIPKMGSGGTY